MEVVWRTLLSLFLVAVLLIDCVSNAQQTTTCTTAVSAEDVSRATVAAAGVFEGRLELLEGPASSSSSSLNATFSFRRSHKGKFRRVSSKPESRPEVVVILDLAEDLRGCSLSGLLVVQRNYLVFVGRSVETEETAEVQSDAVFQSSVFPIPLTQEAVKQIRDYQCRKCG